MRAAGGAVVNVQWSSSSLCARKSVGDGSVEAQGQQEGPRRVLLLNFPVCWRFSLDRTRRSSRSCSTSRCTSPGRCDSSDLTQEAGPVDLDESVVEVRYEEASVFHDRVATEPSADGVAVGLASVGVPNPSCVGCMHVGCHVLGHCGQQAFGCEVPQSFTHRH